ncbi:hypothetical protein ACQRUO_39775, partial [Kitasatospora sp. LaBMicrA B282]
MGWVTPQRVLLKVKTQWAYGRTVSRGPERTVRITEEVTMSLVLDPAAQDLLFREAHTANTFT